MHCSDSSWGNENAINSWHRVRRFLTMVDGYHLSTGYHLVILNGRPYSDNLYYEFLDGSLETARSFQTQGAGVKGDNTESIHICMIGKPGEFTEQQYKKLYEILFYFVRRGIITIDDIWGHYEYWTKKGEKPLKSCPGIKMNELRGDFEQFIVGEERAAISKTKTAQVDKTLLKILRGVERLLGKQA